MRLILVRGLPGSGKTTLAKLLASQLNCAHLEGDQYFEVPYGGGRPTVHGYHYVPELIRDAHRRCRELARHILLEKGQDVIVANTFTRIREMRPYLDMADTPMVDLTVYTCCGEWESVHNVPDEAMNRMKDRWEDYESENFYHS